MRLRRPAPSASAATYGEVLLESFPGGVRVLDAPGIALMSLAVVAESRARVLRVSGDRVVLCDQVEYRVTGWRDGALLMVLEEDRRPAAARPGAADGTVDVEPLADPVYIAAFDKAMKGQADTLTEQERAAVERARTATGTPGPAYPVPITDRES